MPRRSSPLRLSINTNSSSMRCASEPPVSKRKSSIDSNCMPRRSPRSTKRDILDLREFHIQIANGHRRHQQALRRARTRRLRNIELMELDLPRQLAQFTLASPTQESRPSSSSSTSSSPEPWMIAPSSQELRDTWAALFDSMSPGSILRSSAPSSPESSSSSSDKESVPAMSLVENLRHHATRILLEHFTRLTSVIGLNTHNLNAALSRLQSSLKLDSPLHNFPHALPPYFIPNEPQVSTVGDSSAEDAFIKAQAAAEETILLIGLVGQDLQKFGHLQR